MAKQKTYSESDQIGEEGQKLAALVVTQLGHIWHDRRIDHGIDGEIELVDQIGRGASNVHILVQSKASSHSFPGETEDSFHFLLDPDDVAYWQNGSNKVIIICSHPSDGEIWWAPAERAVPPRPGRKSWRLTFDKSRDRLDAESVGRLQLWATDATPGRAVSGRRRQRETLDTNLVLIDQLPETIYFGPTWKGSARALGPALRDRGYYRSDWIVRGGVVYSFSRPERDGLGGLLDGGFESIETHEWAESKDRETLTNFADLLRQGLLEQEYRKLWYHRKKRLFVFRSPQDDRDAVKVKVRSNKSGRTVFQRYYKDAQKEQPKDCRHYAASLRFLRTGEGWATEINPTYHFTFDGRRELPWGEDRIKGMKKIEKNPAVRGLVRFWAEYLSRPLELGDSERPISFGSLLTFDVEIGINDSDWAAPISDQTGEPVEFLQQDLLS